MMSSGQSIEDLRRWKDDYLQVDGLKLTRDHPVIKATEQEQDIGHDDFLETRIKQVMEGLDVQDGFCKGCRYAFANWPYLDTRSRTHGIVREYSTVEIEAGYRCACRFCAFHFTQLSNDKYLDVLRQIEHRLDIIGSSSSIKLSVCDIGSEEPGRQLLWLNYPGRVDKYYGSRAGLVEFISQVAGPTAYNPGYPTDQLELARTWIRRCTSSHEACCNKRELRWPRRLVSVLKNKVQLVSTDNFDELPSYTTLSYCWGQKGFLKLTNDNFDTFREQIPVSKLPGTILDAIDITRRLGIGFIWIDALCIIQQVRKTDHNKDWLDHSPLMRSIYGGAHVNIAASTATDVYGGCLIDRCGFNRGCFARITTSDYGCFRIFYPTFVYDELVLNVHLANRAWALQERLLAPRTISFGNHGLFWECRSKIASEDLPDGCKTMYGRHLVCPEDASWSWDKIVEEYSKAQLTYDMDKLPAMAGIAKRQHENTGDDYLAGMWRKNLICQLDWRPIMRGKRPPQRAPSWSWCAVNSAVDPSVSGILSWECSQEGEFFAAVIDAQVDLAGSDQFGSVTGGALQLMCDLILEGKFHKQASIEQDFTRSALENQFNFQHEGQMYPIRLDCSDEETLNEDEPLQLVPLNRAGSWSRRKKESPEHDVDQASDRSEDDYDLESIMVLFGLVLQVVDPSGDQYRRIGSVWYSNDPDPDSWIPDLPFTKHFYDTLSMNIATSQAFKSKSESAAKPAKVEGLEFGKIITIV